MRLETVVLRFAHLLKVCDDLYECITKLQESLHGYNLNSQIYYSLLIKYTLKCPSEVMLIQTY